MGYCSFSNWRQSLSKWPENFRDAVLLVCDLKNLKAADFLQPNYSAFLKRCPASRTAKAVTLPAGVTPRGAQGAEPPLLKFLFILGGLIPSKILALA